MVRLTVRDREKIVSFRGSVELARALVAACASSPQRFEDLLVAVEPFEPGTADAVMRQLLRFDQALQAQYTMPLSDAFEVTDAASERTARRPDDEGVVYYDLPETVITGELVTDEPLEARGVLRMDPIAGAVARETVYALDDQWRVQVFDLTESSKVGYA